MCSFPEFNSYSDNDIPVLPIKNNHSININSYFFENNQNTNHTNQLQDFDFNDFSDFSLLNNPPSFPENTFNSILEDENNDELNDENNNRYIYISPQKKKKKIFYTKKEVKKILGRKKKYTPYKGHNGKSRRDLIFQKIKIKFLTSLINYINNKIIKLYTHKKYLLKNINSPFIQSNVKIVKEYLNKKIIEIYSDKLSKKYKSQKLGNFSNKKIINDIIEENKAFELIDIFINKTLKDMYEIYISNNVSDFCLKNDIEKLSKKNEYDQNYLNEYEKKAKHFISIIQNINSKKTKKKNKNN